MALKDTTTMYVQSVHERS